MHLTKNVPCAVCLFVAACGSAAFAAAPNDVIHPGTTAWAAAAQSSRADLLILGDSVVLTQGNGWDAGFNTALSNTVGLAGGGLSNGGSDGEGFSAGPYFGSPWSPSLSLVPAEKRGYVWRGNAWTIGSTPNSGQFSFYSDGSTLSSTAGYDLTLYTASGTGTGSTGAGTRKGIAPYTPYQSLPAVPTAAPAGAGLNKLVFHFDSPTDPADQVREMYLTGAVDTTLFYGRLTAPGKTGATVTSWGYGGQSALSFLNDVWLDSSVSRDGRTAFLNALVDGGSGKLNVLINEGFNDRNDPRPSYNNVAPSNTAAGHADNLGALIAAIRADWTAAGRPLADLSFTLMSDYKDYWEGQEPQAPLGAYAAAEALLAASDPQISYIDLYGRSPTYDELNALGYMTDTTHANKAGTDFFAQQAVSALIPEPATLSFLGLVGAAALTRRHRRGSQLDR